MGTPFETATRVAIEEIILERLEASKFGYFLSRDGVRDLTNDIFELLQTSRSLKAAGDRMLGAPLPPSGASY